MAPIVECVLQVEVGESVLEQDPRFSFAWSRGENVAAPLLIAVHGSERDHVETRDAFRSLADRHSLNVIAPLFPKNVSEPGYSDGYKFLQETGIDYVVLIDAMIAQFAAMQGRAPSALYLFGFSGGAQFAERYALFDGAKLDGLLLAAPGSVTLLDETIEWWPGLSQAEQIIGRKPDLAAFLKLPIVVLVGSQDLSPGLDRNDPTQKHGSVHAGLAGNSRVDKARALHRSIASSGGNCRYVEVEGAAHKLNPNADAASGILAEWLVAASNHNKERD